MTTTLNRPRAQAPATIVDARSPHKLLRKEMDDLLTRFWDNDSKKGCFGGGVAPLVDLIEGDSIFEIRMDIPWMNAKDIDVRVHGNSVTRSGRACR